MVQGFLYKPITRHNLVSELKKILSTEDKINQYKTLEKEEVFNNLTLENTKDLLNLVTSLEEDYMEEWHIIQQTKITAKIRNFANKLEQEALKYKCKILLDYALILQDQISCFELDLLEKSLGEFPDIIQKIVLSC